MTSVAPLFIPLLLPSWLDPQHIVQAAGASALWLVALIVFAECGLAIFFMPGDSLLFAIGMFTAVGLSAGSEPLIQYGGKLGTLLVVNLVLMVAAVAGNVVGYWIGHRIGPSLFRERGGIMGRLFAPKHLAKTEEFFVRHGPVALILARFVPVVRTFVTMVAGIGRMNFRRFISSTAIGGVAWVLIAVQAGHFLGQVPFIRDNFEVVVVLIVLISVLPMVVEWLKARRAAPAGATSGSSAPEGPAQPSSSSEGPGLAASAEEIYDAIGENLTRRSSSTD